MKLDKKEILLGSEQKINQSVKSVVYPSSYVLEAVPLQVIAQIKVLKELFWTITSGNFQQTSLK